jgi:shikimate kinase
MTDGVTARRDRVYLTGFMGSGKSTVGPILANTIGYDFVDLDRTIEEAEGVAIGELFRLRGEHYFRLREKEAIERLPRDRKLVVALGGGALVDPGNFQTVTTTGIMVYLRLPAASLWKRLRRRGGRPLLADENGERVSDELLRDRIESLLRLREPLYAKADLIVDVDERQVGLTVDRVVRSLAPLLR